VSKRTRNRQLARLAAQRQMDKRRQQRKRQTATIAVALVVALLGSVVAFLAFTGGDGRDTASPPTGPSGRTTPTGPTGDSGVTPTPSGKPGTQTGTVDPTPGPSEVACGADVPADATKPKPQFNAPKQVLEDGVTYTATFQTSCGDIVVELLADQAPETVNSFVFLAQEGYFDGQRIHRIDTSIDVLQGGDPSGTGTNGPGYVIPDELTGDESYGPGTLAMANAGVNSGGSQFFLITGENGHNLDSNPAYTIFGMIREGLDVAQQIQALDIQDPAAAAAGDLSGQQPAQAVYIERVTISSAP
jgi:cyclophilin family peptidyl-prolyl cis-trans isomerase